MTRRVLAIALTVGLFTSAGLGAATIAAGSADSSGGGKFKPKQFTGKWSGKWTNHTFKTKGSATMSLKLKGKKLIGVFDLGGNAFGCADPDPRKQVMKKGKGANSWNKKGFKVSYDNGQGPVKLSYKSKKQKFSGSGTSPCTPDITYTYDGKMTKKKVTADVEIFNQSGKFAESSLKMNKK